MHFQALAILQSGGRPDSRDKAGLTPVHFAAAGGHDRILGHLASVGAELDPEDSNGRTPLHHAAVQARPFRFAACIGRCIVAMLRCTALD